MKKKLFTHSQHSFIMKLNKFWQVVDGQTVIDPMIQDNHVTARELQTLGYLDEIKLRGQVFFVPTSKLTKYLGNMGR